MAEDELRAARLPPGAQQELPPPPRLVQYGVTPTRQTASREGGGAVAAPLPLREDQRLEAERRRQLAHSIRMLKAARHQQEVRVGCARTAGIPPSPDGVVQVTPVTAPASARLPAVHRQPTMSGHVNHAAAVAAATSVQAAGPIRTLRGSGRLPPPPMTVERSAGDGTRPSPLAAVAATLPADGHLKIVDRPPSVATTGPTPLDSQLKNGANRDRQGGSVESRADRPVDPPASLGDGRSGGMGEVTAKRASPPATEGTEPASKRSRSEAGCDIATAATRPAADPASALATSSASAPAALTALVTAPASAPATAAAIPAADTTSARTALASPAAAGDTVPSDATSAAAAAASIPAAGPVSAATAAPTDTNATPPATASTVPAAAPAAAPAAPLAVAHTAAPAAASAATPALTATPATTAVRADAAVEATASPTHKGKKSWLSRLATAEEPTDGAMSSDASGERSSHTPSPEMNTSPSDSPPAEDARRNGDEPPAESEEQDVQDSSSSGEGDSTTNGADESNGVLAPRAAAAATKAAAAVKRSPGRPRKKPGVTPAGDPKRPSVMALKKSGESFAQTNFCCQIAAKLPRCRECRAVPMQRHNKPTGIYCRFTAFRKVRYTRTGHLSATGFCDPYSDAGSESDRLWRASPDGPPTMEPEIAKFLLAHVGNQFCDLVCEEEAARRCHMSEEKTVAWKRVVQGCREMCDVCETTLFNVHWVCSRCGFAVCVDCYRSRRDGTAKDWGEQLAERDQFRWLLCGAKPHQQDKLVLTQIVAGDALETLNRQVHEARQKAGLPLSCECEVAKRIQAEAGEAAAKSPPTADSVVKTVPGLGAAAVKTEGGGGMGGDRTGKPAAAPLSFLADVALSKITSDDSDSDDSDDWDDAGGGSLALRRLLVPGTQADAKPKTVKKERLERPKRSGWSMGDSLDEVLDKMSARCHAAAPASHTASGPAALQHFVRRCASKRGLRERLPIRIMTLGESTRLYPAVRHSWLCDGKLLRLHESDAADSVRLFRDQWKRGQPVICSGIGGDLDRSLWSVDAFIRDFGDVRNDLINCRTGNIVPNQPMRHFWGGFESVTRRLRDDKGQPMILKLKDWPPGEDFADMMPRRFNDLMSVLPMTDYTRRDGRLNLASCLPDCFVRPDLGPKMYIAYGCALHPSKASTNLHLDVSDAVNIMVHVGIPPDGDADNAEALRAIDEAGCDQLTKRRVRDEMPGALWHIYHAADADKIRDLLNKMAIERGDQLEPHHDPIHDQSWYLDGPLRRRLYEEYRVEGYPIVQCAGDAVFIPAGAPHQVRNLHSCIKVAEDFVSPENIGHCFDLTQEFRSLSDTHTNHEDKLQIKNIIYHAMKDAVSCLLGAARPASAAGGHAAGTSAAGGHAAEGGSETAVQGSQPAAPAESGVSAAAVEVKSEPDG